MWQAPGAQQRQPSPGSPSQAGSPAGAWTSITHNSLYNASPVSSPPRPSPAPASSAAADGGSQAGSSGSEAHGPAAPSSPAVDAPLTQWGSLSVVADPWQQQQQQQEGGDVDEDEECMDEMTVQLQDAALRSVLGIGLDQLRAGGEQVGGMNYTALLSNSRSS